MFPCICLSAAVINALLSAIDRFWGEFWDGFWVDSWWDLFGGVRISQNLSGGELSPKSHIPGAIWRTLPPVNLSEIE